MMPSLIFVLTLLLCFVYCCSFQLHRSAIVRLATSRHVRGPDESSPYFQEVKLSSELFERQQAWTARSNKRIGNLSSNSYFRKHPYDMNQTLLVEENLEEFLVHMDDLKRERFFAQEEIAFYPDHWAEYWVDNTPFYGRYASHWDPVDYDVVVSRVKLVVDFFAYEEARRILGGGGPKYVAAFATRIMKQCRNPIQKDSTISYESKEDKHRLTLKITSPDKSRVVKFHFEPREYAEIESDWEPPLGPGVSIDDFEDLEDIDRDYLPMYQHVGDESDNILDKGQPNFGYNEMRREAEERGEEW